MGRLFFTSEINPLLNIGVTTAFFKELGNLSCEKHKLNTDSKIGANIWKCSLDKKTRIEFKFWFVFFNFTTILTISSVEIGERYNEVENFDLNMKLDQYSL